MSWDVMRDDLYRSRCACGRGCVEFRSIVEVDDWNRSRDIEREEIINCLDCSEKYHIEKESYYYYKHKGDEGTVVTRYLVPNGQTIRRVCEVDMPILGFEEQLVVDYPVSNLREAVEDMKTNKYSTRLQNEIAKDIVSRYSEKYKKRGLPEIIKVIEHIIQHYDKYEWTKEKYESQKKLVAREQNTVNKANKDARRCSYKLRFRIVEDE